MCEFIINKNVSKSIFELEFESNPVLQTTPHLIFDSLPTIFLRQLLRPLSASQNYKLPLNQQYLHLPTIAHEIPQLLCFLGQGVPQVGELLEIF